MPFAIVEAELRPGQRDLSTPEVEGELDKARGKTDGQEVTVRTRLLLTNPEDQSIIATGSSQVKVNVRLMTSRPSAEISDKCTNKKNDNVVSSFIH